MVHRSSLWSSWRCQNHAQRCVLENFRYYCTSLQKYINQYEYLNKYGSNWRFGSKEGRPKRGEMGYHCMGWGFDFFDKIRDACQAQWEPGQSIYSEWIHLIDLFWDFVVDEGRVRDTLYQTRDKEKPIRKGRNIYRCCDMGRYADGFVWDSIIYCGKYTFLNSKEGLVHNIVKRFITISNKSFM